MGGSFIWEGYIDFVGLRGIVRLRVDDRNWLAIEFDGLEYHRYPLQVFWGRLDSNFEAIRENLPNIDLQLLVSAFIRELLELEQFSGAWLLQCHILKVRVLLEYKEPSKAAAGEMGDLDAALTKMWVD